MFLLGTHSQLHPLVKYCSICLLPTDRLDTEGPRYRPTSLTYSRELINLGQSMEIWSVVIIILVFIGYLILASRNLKSNIFVSCGNGHNSCHPHFNYPFFYIVSLIFKAFCNARLVYNCHDYKTVTLFSNG